MIIDSKLIVDNPCFLKRICYTQIMRTNDFIMAAALPEDMQVLLADYGAIYGAPATREHLFTDKLPLRKIPLANFPITELDPTRIITHNPNLPPVIVHGKVWLDGRHRVAAARKAGETTITAIDLQAYNLDIPTNSSDYLGEINK